MLPECRMETLKMWGLLAFTLLFLLKEIERLRSLLAICNLQKPWLVTCQCLLEIFVSICRRVYGRCVCSHRKKGKILCTPQLRPCGGGGLRGLIQSCGLCSEGRNALTRSARCSSTMSTEEQCRQYKALISLHQCSFMEICLILPSFGKDTTVE